ncbi:hypothetical protein GPECTOR_10g1067 [Gonium pectorale]|uniref:Uncharacterized protein n=1 Tax=Gonium pectorale TaxID=33097 RepID=A0A150GQI0_GONPE|nr:hypothetical protein GPECTOR_10g1067 [Gonium pectorale]|eukprot:KXZ52044.1 hypothetical protein GPECTOR_10g1067 [Gonium pectorale]
MDEAWRRYWIFGPRQPPDRQLAPGDRVGISLYLELQDCLDSHRYHVVAGVAALTIPYSVLTKGRTGPLRHVRPFLVGVLFSLVPDMVYANVKCSDKHIAFKRHCDAVKGAMQQQQQQQLERGQGLQADGSRR